MRKLFALTIEYRQVHNVTRHNVVAMRRCRYL